MLLKEKTVFDENALPPGTVVRYVDNNDSIRTSESALVVDIDDGYVTIAISGEDTCKTKTIYLNDYINEGYYITPIANKYGEIIQS